MTNTSQQQGQTDDSDSTERVCYLDKIDKQILHHLLRDARNVSAQTIADEVDVTSGTIRNRIKRLEDNGVIAGYHVTINYRAIDHRLTTLFICTVSPEKREQCVRDVARIPGVIHVRRLLNGRSNLHVKGIAETATDLNKIERELIACGVTIEHEKLLQDERFEPPGIFVPE